MSADEELAEATLRRMLDEIRPEWSLREAVPAAEGTDVVYFVTAETPDGPRECVLKACEFLDAEEFRTEPHLLKLVTRRTSIPVPRVLGAVDDHADLPAPFFLMERRDGEVRENEARELPADVMERLAHDAGRYLAELHDLGEFEAFGPIRLAADAEPSETTSVTGDGLAIGDDTPIGDGIAVGDQTLTTDETAHDSWQTRVEAIVEDCLNNLHDRFEDLETGLRGSVDDRLGALDREFTPVFGDDDYRLGNLLVDPATGETQAVLDWGNPNTLEVQYNLVLTEQYLSGWAPHDDPLRERVRTALRKGYREVGDLPDDPDAERRRDLYLTVTRLFPLVWFSLWYGQQSDSKRDVTAEKHREAILDLV
jgi:hypothetical protein